MHVTPHELRHSMASFCAAANVNPRPAMDALGHSTVKMTMEYYQHVSDTMRCGIADGIGRLLFDGDSSILARLVVNARHIRSHLLKDKAKNPCARRANSKSTIRIQKRLVEMGGVEPPSRMFNRMALQA